MPKKTHNIPKEGTEKPLPKKYIGAEWVGPEGLSSPEFGELKKGKIFSIDEARAKNSNDWRPVYESKI